VLNKIKFKTYTNTVNIKIIEAFSCSFFRGFSIFYNFCQYR